MNSKNSGYLIAFVLILLFVGLFLWQQPDTTSPGVGTPSQTGEVATTTPPATATVRKTQTKPVTSRVFENGVYVTIVNYTSRGFEPTIITIHKGEEVRFVNKSDSSMRIASSIADGKLYLASINQPKSVGKGGVYQLMITEVGVWNFHNIDNKNRDFVGILYVY
ncbi:MAG TPA: hypothetical protein VJH94_05395 [Candidatus Paceibacterota bacterium]